MTDDDRANKACPPAAERGVIARAALPGSLDSVRGNLEDYQQYSDIMLVATLQDYAQAGRALELNERPAFRHSPRHVARLLFNEKQEGLLTYVANKHA